MVGVASQKHTSPVVLHFGALGTRDIPEWPGHLLPTAASLCPQGGIRPLGGLSHREAAPGHAPGQANIAGLTYHASIAILEATHPKSDAIHAATQSALLINPRTVRNVAAMRRSLQAELTRASWPEAQCFEASGEDSGERWLRDAVAGGVKLVFVCGGDGTVRTSLNVLADTKVTVAIIPRGTANVLALNLGLPGSIATCVHLATNGSRRSIDLGEVNGQLFASMTGIGLDAKIMASTNRQSKRLVGWLAYAWAALGHLNDRPFNVSIKLDDQEPVQCRARSVLIGNVSKLPGGINFLPAASPDDGLLDLAIIAPRQIWNWPDFLARAALGRPNKRELQTFQATNIEITTDSPQPMEIDGNILPPASTLKLRIRPKALIVCAP